MNSITHRVLRSASVGAVAILGALALIPNGAQAQWRVGGAGYGTSVKALGTTAQSPVATLPADGGYAVGEATTFGVPNTIAARWLTAVTTGSGSQDAAPASAQTISELENVNVLNGLVRADNVTAVASSYANGTGAGSNADGSGFVNLVVNGNAIRTDVAPNTRINIPLVGYVILNEQARTGDGVTSSGMNVNMVHVRLLDGTDIIVGSASSSVGR
jgi:hypothetical protein